MSGNPRFAYDSYRRFIQMYSDVVLGVEHYNFEEILEIQKEELGVLLDTELDADALKSLVAAYKARVEDELGKPFPQDPKEQLWGAIGAVFGSWMTPRAVTYRRLHDIPKEWGTAVSVQAMVFGNMGDDCATGVAFTRDPSTGENTFFGEYLVNAQGEDVVAGTRTPQHLTVVGKQANGSDLPAMEEVMPEVFGQLDDIRSKLEAHYRDMQDIEFTVQKGKLWMLQTRNGKRTTQAALRIAVEMADSGVIDRPTAVSRIEPNALDQLLHPTLDPAAERQVIAKGLPASPGAASGKAVFTADEAEAEAAKGERVVLVRTETSPEDIHGMHAARGRHDGGRQGCRQRRLDHHRRRHRRGHAGPGADRATGAFGRFLAADGMGRRIEKAGCARQCRYAGRRPHIHRIRRRGHRALPYRTYVLRGRAHHRGARNDPGRDRGRSPPRAGQDPADAARGFRRDVPHHGWTAGHDPPA
jgi:pyruvate,orthophosphate dikinase